jgi:WhiB family transcriptional regulator, redox-sensing transcriptional regulator
MMPPTDTRGTDTVTEAVVAGALARPGSTPSFSVSVGAPPWLKTNEVLSCLQQYETFFPPNYGLVYHKEIEAAQALCEQCPVRDLCKAWAVEQTDLDGIWGGTTPPMRRRIRTGKLTPREREQAA